VAIPSGRAEPFVQPPPWRNAPDPKTSGTGIKRAKNASAALIEHMGVNHRRLNVFMPQQFLDSPNIIMILQEMGSKAVTEGMATDPFINSRRVKKSGGKPVIY
jgi:hypothetical protein